MPPDLRTPALLTLGIALAACASDDSSTTGVDASYGVTEALDASDATLTVSADAGPAVSSGGSLWERCDPSNVASCPAGFECFGGDTSPVNAHGLCVFSCAGGNGSSCILSGGTCACPETPGGAPGDCSSGNATGLVTICVPAGDAGASGENQLEEAGGTPIEAGAAGDGSSE
jgi:hypothetical protein